MAVVGYFAEKNDFIKKSQKKEKPKKVKEVKKEQPIVIEDKGIDELLKAATEKDEKKFKEMVGEVEEPVNDDIMSPLVSEPEENNTIDESLFAPLESEDNAELNNIEVTPLSEIDSNEEVVNEEVVNEEEDIWKF